MTVLAGISGCAAPPTVDEVSYTEAICKGTSGDVKLTVNAQRYASGETSSAVQVTYLNGDYVGEGQVESSWTDSTFSATVPVADPVLGTGPVAEVRFSGSYGSPGPAQTRVVESGEGTIRITETFTSTPLELTVDTLTYDGADVTIEKCEASHENYRRETTNPRIRLVQFATANCTMTDATEYYLERETSQVGGSVPYVITVVGAAGTSASGTVQLGRDGTWNGEMTVFSETGDSQVPARAERDRVGLPRYDTQKTDTGRIHAWVRPYRLTLSVHLPEGTAELDCELVEVVQTMGPPDTVE